MVGAQLISLVPARGLWVDANFKESQLAHIRPGLPASIEADVLPGQVFHGHVGSLAPATGAQFSVLPPENATGNFTKIVQRVPVRILLDGDASMLGSLRPGLSVPPASTSAGRAHYERCHHCDTGKAVRLVRRALDEGEGFCLCHDVRRLLYCASGYPDRLGFSGRDRRRIVGRTR
jgi:hypothetical protein